MKLGSRRRVSRLPMVVIVLVALIFGLPWVVSRCMASVPVSASALNSPVVTPAVTPLIGDPWNEEVTPRAWLPVVRVSKEVSR